MLSYYGHIRVELSDIVKIELTSIRPKAGRSARYSRYLYITTDDGSVYTLQLKAENKAALTPKDIE
jgi:hypothetical protein